MVAENASGDRREVTLTDDVAKRLDDMARALGKTRDEVANEVLAAHLTEDERFVAAAEEGRAARARGDVHAWDDVKALLAERKTKFRNEHGL